jgi:ABC-2 type transport system ATP-binding protein
MAGLLSSVANCERRSDKHKMQEGSKMETWEIEARGLTKTFGSFAAARNLNIRVPRGTIFGFLGPNGSGKSTTVKLLTGLLTPTAGDALIAGEPVAVENVSFKRKIGVLSEDDALFRALTIWEHLELSGPLYGLSREETESRATQLLRHLDLWQERGTYVEQASFGMRKKCGLAMALLHNPQVLFLDEPFEGIDPGSSRNIKDLLLTLARKGVTIFLTSHILEVVERLVGQYAIIIDGEIVCQQTVEETIAAGRTLEDVYFQFVGRPAMEEMAWLG